MIPDYEEATLSIDANFRIDSWITLGGFCILGWGGLYAAYYFGELTIGTGLLIIFLALVIAAGTEIEVSWTTTQKVDD